MLVQYVYDYFSGIINPQDGSWRPIGKPVGCVVAVDKDKIGYSICSPKEKKFDKKLAREIAMSRANKVTDECVYESPVPVRMIINHEDDLVDIDNSLEDAINNIVDRANRYFK